MSMSARAGVLPWCLAVLAGSASAQAPPEVAPVESATGSAVSTGTAPGVLGVLAVRRRVPFADAIGEERRARADRVRRARAEDDPFQPSGVWLPPLYLADAEHSVEWIGLLYVDTVDFEEGERARLLAPFFLSLTGPEERTLITPLFGGREDAQGEAGYAGNYVWRRDRLADSDVVFPFFWSFRERDFDEGPDARSAGAIAPLVFWRRRTSGEHWTVAPPLFWRRGDAHETTTLAGPAFSIEEPGRSWFGAFPLYLGRRDDDGSAVDACLPLLALRTADAEGHALLSPFVLSWSDPASATTIVPPALFLRRSDADGSSTFALNTYYGTRPEGSTLWSFPLFWRRTDPGEHDTGVLPFWFGGERDGGRWRYDVVPPLLFGRASDEEAGTSSTFLLNTYYDSRPDGHTLASFPLFLDEREGASSLTVVPPLLFGRVSDEEVGTSSTFLLNTYYDSRPDGHTLASFPLFLDEREGASRLTVVPPLLFGRASDDEAGASSTFLLNTYYGARPDGYTLASFPFAFARRDGEDLSLLIPPALTYHETDGETSRTFALNTYVHLGPDGWDFAFAPLVFAGGAGDASHVVAFPLLWRFADATSTTTVVAPFFHVGTPDGAWHTGFAPLWFSGRFEDGSRYDLAPPLVWRFEGDDGTRLAVLPLFDYSRDATRTRVISPLMYHRADADTVEDASSMTIALGLYWDLRDPETHTRVAFPLWWQHEDSASGRGLATLFPLYWRRQGVDETTHVLLNTAWTDQNEGPGWSFHLFPLFDLASDEPDHFHWQVAGGLLGREHRGARHRWRVAYAWTEPSEGP